MTTIIIADDHQIVRQGIRTLLETEIDLKIVGEAADGIETTRITEQLHPDVLIADLMMGNLSGIEVTRQVSKRCPHTNVLIYSMYGNEGYVLEALQAGAKGYILKESPSGELVKAVREVSIGRHYLSSPLSERAIEGYINKTEDAVMDTYEILSSREREVLNMVVHGHTSMEIAHKLCLSRRTVETHRSNMMRKLGIHNQTELLRYALQKGLVPHT